MRHETCVYGNIKGNCENDPKLIAVSKKENEPNISMAICLECLNKDIRNGLEVKELD